MDWTNPEVDRFLHVVFQPRSVFMCPPFALHHSAAVRFHRMRSGPQGRISRTRPTCIQLDPLREARPSKMLYGYDLEIAGSAIEIYTVLGDLEEGIMRRGVFEARTA